MRVQIKDLFVEKPIPWNDWIADPYYNLLDKEEDEIALCTKLEHFQNPFEVDIELLIYNALYFAQDFLELFEKEIAQGLTDTRIFTNPIGEYFFLEEFNRTQEMLLDSLEDLKYVFLEDFRDFLNTTQHIADHEVIILLSEEEVETIFKLSEVLFFKHEIVKNFIEKVAAPMSISQYAGPDLDRYSAYGKKLLQR